MDITNFPHGDIGHIDWTSIDENNKTYIIMEQVTLNKETYDKLMDIELKKDQEIDKLNDIIKELESGCVSVRVKYRTMMFHTEKHIDLITNDEKTKTAIEEIKYLFEDESSKIKKDHTLSIDKIYNRNIFQRIFNKRV